MKALSRRDFGRLIAAGAAVGALAGRTGRAFAETRLRYIWWGNPDRDKRTNAAVDLYHKKNPDISVDRESYAWADYWPKLATQAAGRNLPDVIQMDYRYIFEWARRGQLADLTPMVGKELKLDNFDKNQLDSGKIGGKLYGLSMGGNSVALVYNKTQYDALKITLPDPLSWTFDDFIKLAKDVQPHLPDGVHFTANKGDNESWLEMFVRQRGKELYTEGGQLGFELDDLIAFWTIMTQMQKDGLTPPPDVQAQDTTGALEKTMLVLGKAITDFTNSNQLVAIQKLMKDQVDLTTLPNQEGNRPGQYMKPSMFISQSASSAEPEQAAKLLNFMITDVDAGEILQIERGVPADSVVLKHIEPSLTEVEQRMTRYLTLLAKHVGPLPPPPPKGAGEIQQLLYPAYQTVSFGRASVEDGAKDFMQRAKDILKRA
ncbi:MAG: ABC transporter substrate-binding protein [Rhizobiaceae bacterium]